MNDPEGNILKMTIGGDRQTNVSVAQLIRYLSGVLSVLRDLDAKISKTNQKTLRWEIVEVAMNSPLTVTIAGRPRAAKTPYSKQVAKKYREGIRLLEHEAKSPPYFSAASIQKTKKLITYRPEGVETVTFDDPESRQTPIRPTKQLVENVKTVLNKTFYTSPTTLEGRLEKLDVHGRFSFVIYDTLNNHPIHCEFDEAMFERIPDLLRRRVLVEGDAKFDRITSQPISIIVRDINKLRESSELPRFAKGEYIDITGGVESAEFIRRSRDAE